MARDTVTVRLPNGRTVVMDGPVARREIAAGRAVLAEPTTATAAPPETAMKPRPYGRRRG